MNEEIWNSPEQSDYRTGRTDPPKTRRGMLAICMMAAIFFAGVFTAASILDIPLFSPEEKPGENAIRFSVAEDFSGEDRQEEGFGLGISGQTLSDFDRQYYRLPEGVYITAVAPGSQAARKGLVAGDILVAVDGAKVKTTEELSNVLAYKTVGEKLELVIYRRGRQHRVIVTLGSDKKEG